jgi:hypothetical protein
MVSQIVPGVWLIQLLKVEVQLFHRIFDDVEIPRIASID